MSTQAAKSPGICWELPAKRSATSPAIPGPAGRRSALLAVANDEPSILVDRGQRPGFDPAKVGKLGHQGLANIRERAARIGATITIDSASGRGTRLVIHFQPFTAGGPGARV